MKRLRLSACLVSLLSLLISGSSYAGEFNAEMQCLRRLYKTVEGPGGSQDCQHRVLSKKGIPPESLELVRFPKPEARRRKFLLAEDYENRNLFLKGHLGMLSNGRGRKGYFVFGDEGIFFYATPASSNRIKLPLGRGKDATYEIIPAQNAIRREYGRGGGTPSRREEALTDPMRLQFAKVLMSVIDCLPHYSAAQTEAARRNWGAGEIAKDALLKIRNACVPVLRGDQLSRLRNGVRDGLGRLDTVLKRVRPQDRSYSPDDPLVGVPE